MLRKDRERDAAFAWEGFQKAPYATLSLTDEVGKPYAIPISPVVDEAYHVVYFHCAGHGEMWELLAKYPPVCLSAGSYAAAIPIEFSMAYASAALHGRAEVVTDEAEQVKAMLLLCTAYDPKGMGRFSEYMEKYAVSRMIGSPPGYVGYEEAGQLTEKVRRRPYSVVLFDEIEKAHPDVMNILLQILDEGKINDAQGRTVDFSNTVICMTSNAGSSDKTTSGLGFNKSEEQLSEEKTRKALSQFLRPEFLGRVDEVIAFKPLSQQTLEGIAALMLDEYKPSMEAKGIAYSYTPAALSALVAKSQGGKFGARDLRRVIRKAVEDPAAERIIVGTLKAGGSLTVDAENGEVILK